MTRFRSTKTGCMVVALAIALPSVSFADEAAGASMQEELRRQQEMLARIQRGEELEDTDLVAIDAPVELELPDQADPRIAPVAPTDRPLPLAIFEEEKAVVAARAWGDHGELRLHKRVLDADGDGRPELIRYVDPATESLVRQEEDRNYDGTTDAWSDYREGVIESRILDSNDDGTPDVFESYRERRMSRREIDRDDDGVRDAFYSYRGDSLVDEQHDADNDGRIDLHVTYRKRHRVIAEEDQDRDGRVDTWSHYRVVGDQEVVSRIERDKKGRGSVDTVEIYEAVDGKAILSRREEDLDGDGEPDVLSHYEKGKLIRREIRDPDLVPL